MTRFFPSIFTASLKITPDSLTWYSDWIKIKNKLKNSLQVEKINERDMIILFRLNSEPEPQFRVGVEYTGFFHPTEIDETLPEVEFRPVRKGSRIESNLDNVPLCPKDILPMIREHISEEQEGLLRLERFAQKGVIKLRYLLDVFDKSEENKPCHLN